MSILHTEPPAHQSEYQSDPTTDRSPDSDTAESAARNNDNPVWDLRNIRKDIFACTFCKFSISCYKPLDYKIPEMRNTLGDHIRAKRIESGLTQKQLSTQLGCDHLSLGHWELNQHQPSLKFIPRIIEFLGFDPFPEPTDPVRRLRKFRRQKGLRCEDVAKLVGSDPCSISSWERGEHHPTKMSIHKIEKFLDTV
jgi:transcriptional regulator with XRE-family HTH domain